MNSHTLSTDQNTILPGINSRTPLNSRPVGRHSEDPACNSVPMVQVTFSFYFSSRYYNNCVIPTRDLRPPLGPFVRQFRGGEEVSGISYCESSNAPKGSLGPFSSRTKRPRTMKKKSPGGSSSSRVLFSHCHLTQS